jgi:DNA modification methylase
MSSQPQPTANREIVAIGDLKETNGPRLTEIDQEHTENLEENIELEGLIEPIVVTPSSTSEYTYDIVDGRHRKRALERLGVEEVAVYIMPGERDYAVPTREAEVDVDIQSMAANVLRKEQTKAEEARFLIDNIEERIISKFTDEEHKRLNKESDDKNADARVTPLQLTDHLENVGDEEGDWKFSDKHHQELRRLLSAADCAPKTASEHIRFYTDSPQDIVDAWKQDDITKGFVKQLRQIGQEDLRAHALEKSVANGDDGYSTRDVDTVKTIANTDAPRTHEKLVSGDISNLDDAVEQAKVEEEHESGPEEDPEDEDDDGDDTPTTEELKKKLSDDQIEELKELTDAFGERYEIDSWEDLFEYMVNKYDGYQPAIIDLENHKKYLEKREDLDSYDWDSSQAERDDSLHLARPLEAENLHCFFHSCTEMGAEIDAKEVDLFVFSPPYFTQRGTIPAEEWYTKEGPVDTKEKLNGAYRDFLEAMKEAFVVLHNHLAQGGHIIFVVSDIQSAYEGGDTKPRYDVPSDLSNLIRTEMNPDYAEEEQLSYENTIVWEKGYGKGAERFIGSGDPADYQPNDTTERILVYRKGPKTSTEFNYPKPDQFREYFDSLWQIHPDSDGPHPALYPVELVKPLVQLYTSPGDTVADPMVGGGTTLRALWELNAENNSTPPRTGYAWENFASEDYDDVNYWKQIYLSFMHTEFGESDILSRLDAFTRPLSV